MIKILIYLCYITLFSFANQNVINKNLNIKMSTKSTINEHKIDMNIIQVIKTSWGWTGINPIEVIGENDFGNLIVKDIDGKYWHICPEELSCEVIAKNRKELDIILKNKDFLHNWYMRNLVTKARKELGSLEKGKKYHLVYPAVLGGKYSIDNIKIVPLYEQINFSGDIGKQIKDLPDGSQIKLKVI